jgi:hypothetical protein
VVPTGGRLGSGGVSPSGGVPTTGGVSATGGVSTVGGTGGTGGNISLIDDMEDGVGDILSVDGRQGVWYTYNDQTAGSWQNPVYGGLMLRQTPITDRPGSNYAAYTTGGGFGDWGAGMGFDLASGSFYDASRYIGVTFWAKVDPGVANVVRFSIADRYSVPEGGYCSANGGCYDHFGLRLLLSTSWQRFSFAWSQLTQRGFGAQRPAIDTTSLRSMQFDALEGANFGIYVDDIAFLR